MTIILPKEKKELWDFIQFAIHYLFKGKENNYDIVVDFEFQDKIILENQELEIFGLFHPHFIGEHNKGKFNIQIKNSRWELDTIAHELTHLWQNVTGKYMRLTKGGFLFKGRKYDKWERKHPVEIEAEKFEIEIVEAWNKL